VHTCYGAAVFDALTDKFAVPLSARCRATALAAEASQDAAHTLYRVLPSARRVDLDPRHSRRAHVTGGDRVGGVAEHFPLRRGSGVLGFGTVELRGLRCLRRKVEAEMSDAERQVARDLLAMRPAPESEPASATLLEKLAKLPATRGNHTELLIDGEATFRAIFESIEQAREYVLVQFFIIHGRRARPAAERRAHREGARRRALLRAL
jgi:hypothetical protein